MNNLCALLRMLSVEYFVFLILAILVCVGLFILLRKTSKDKQKLIKIILLSAIFLFIVIEYVGRIVLLTKFKFFDNLPLETFHIFFYILIFILVTNSKSWAKFAYFIIVPVSLYSMIFIPNIYTTFSSFSISFISFEIINALILSYSVLNFFWSEEYIERKDIINCTVNFIIILGTMHIINIILRFATIGVHANYMATMCESYDTIVALISKLFEIPFITLLPLVIILVGVEYLLLIPINILRNKKEHVEKLNHVVAKGNMKEQQDFRQNGGKTQASHVLVRSETKAKPDIPKQNTQNSGNGFLSTNKQVKVNTDIDSEEKK